MKRASVLVVSILVFFSSFSLTQDKQPPATLRSRGQAGARYVAADFSSGMRRARAAADGGGHGHWQRGIEGRELE